MSFFSRLFGNDYPGLPGYKMISPSLHYRDSTGNYSFDDSSLVILARYNEPAKGNVLSYIQKAAATVVGMRELVRKGYQDIECDDLEHLIYMTLPEELTQKIGNANPAALEHIKNFILPQKEGHDYLLALVGHKPLMKEELPTYQDYVNALKIQWQMDILLYDGKLPPQRDMKTLLAYGVVTSFRGINVHPAEEIVTIVAPVLLDSLYRYLSSPEKIKKLEDQSENILAYKALMAVNNLNEASRQIDFLPADSEDSGNNDPHLPS